MGALGLLVYQEPATWMKDLEASALLAEQQQRIVPLLMPLQVIIIINFVLCFSRPVLCVYVCIENEVFVCMVMTTTFGSWWNLRHHLIPVLCPFYIF